MISARTDLRAIFGNPIIVDSTSCLRTVAYRKFDLLLDGMKKRRSQLRLLLERFEEDYDWIILDCPPNITLLSENIFPPRIGSWCQWFPRRFRRVHSSNFSNSSQKRNYQLGSLCRFSRWYRRVTECIRKPSKAATEIPGVLKRRSFPLLSKWRKWGFIASRYLPTRTALPWLRPIGRYAMRSRRE